MLVCVLMCLYDEVLPYMHNVGLIYNMLKVLLGMNEVFYTCLDDVWSEWYACGLFVSLLSMCEVIVLHMCIALVGLNWD